MARGGVPKALLQGDGDEASTVEWQTREALFDALDVEFGPFTLDPASALGYHTSNVILSRPGGEIFTLDGGYWYETDERPGGPSEIRDGLAVEWSGRVWLNHPYGREDWRWMKKAHDSVRFGSAEIVVALIPVKSQMKWWHKYVGSTQIETQRHTPEPYYGGQSAYDYRYAGFVTKATSPLYRSGRNTGADIRRELLGRERFGGAPSSAPFNSAIAVWRK